MNKKSIIMLSTVLIIILCIGVVAGGGTYLLLNIPSIKTGLQTTNGEFNAMAELQQNVLKAYPCGSARVEIVNGSSLNVSLINSEFDDMSASQQEKNASEIALFVENHYSGNAKINQIVITFVEYHQIGPFNTNRSFSYSFDVSELNEKNPVSG